MKKQNCSEPYNETLLKTEKERTTDTHNDMDETPKHLISEKKDTRDDKLYDSIYVTL